MTDARKEGPQQRVAGRTLIVAAAAAAVWLGIDVGGVVVAPAVVDVRRSLVTAPASATVRAVHVRAGEDVAAGTLVVELDTAALDLELALAEAELERVRVAVRARQIDVNDQDFEVGLRLQADADRFVAALAAATAAAQQDEQDLKNLDALVEKNERLVKEQLAGARDLDELRLRRAAQRERLASSRTAVGTATTLKETAERRFAGWRARPGHEDALLAPDAAAVRAQEERVNIARWRRDQLALRAPMRGRVDDVVVGVGDVVREGAPVFGVFDVAPTAATAWVAEDAAARVAIGDRVALRSIEGGVALRQGVVRALGGGIVEMPARLSPVPGEASFGRAVFIALDGGDGVPLPGQVFEASFVSSSTAAEH